MIAKRLGAPALLVAVLLAAAGFTHATTDADEQDVCPDIPVNDDYEELYPTYKYRCITPAFFVKDGRDLGFGDDPSIDWVRPGINVGACSTSFLLTDDEGNLYLTQSAHCAFASQGNDFCDSTYRSETTIEGYGTAEVVYTSGAHMQDMGATPRECNAYDFAIVKIPEDLHDVTHPRVRHIGGPTDLVDPLTLRHRDPMIGYGNSDDRGFAVEFATGQDHGTLPAWPVVNTFRGYYVGSILNEALCVPGADLFCTDPYDEDPLHGYRQYARYAPSKITGDSGSGDHTADGGAVGVTSVINFATGLNGFMPLYDALLKIHVELGDTYYLVTWDDWTPNAIET